MRLSAISGLSSHAPLFIAIATDLAALSSRLPPPCFFKQLLPDIVKSIAATLRSVLLGVQSSLLSLDGQVGARESLDQALASFNELTEKSGDAGLKDWIRSQLPYRFCSLLCSPSDALVRLHGHRDGAADAEDIVAILRARYAQRAFIFLGPHSAIFCRTGDDEAQKFMQGYAAVSQPRNFEHIQRTTLQKISVRRLEILADAGTAAEMEALLTNALPIFGVPLSEAISRRPSSVRGVPELVSTCAAIIRKTIVPNEANHELFYVFREAPDNYRVSKLIKLLDQGKPVDWAAVPIRDVTGIMRRYLSSLPHSLIPSNLYERCLEASASVAAIKAILQDCPAENVYAHAQTHTYTHSTYSFLKLALNRAHYTGD